MAKTANAVPGTGQEDPDAELVKAGQKNSIEVRSSKIPGKTTALRGGGVGGGRVSRKSSRSRSNHKMQESVLDHYPIRHEMDSDSDHEDQDSSEKYVGNCTPDPELPENPRISTRTPLSPCAENAIMDENVLTQQEAAGSMPVIEPSATNSVETNKATSTPLSLDIEQADVDPNVSTHQAAAGSVHETEPSATNVVETIVPIEDRMSEIMNMLQSMNRDNADSRNELKQFRAEHSQQSSEMSSKFDDMIESQRTLSDAVGVLKAEQIQLKNCLVIQGKGIDDNTENIKELLQEKVRIGNLTKNLSSTQKEIETQLFTTNATMTDSKTNAEKMLESVTTLQDRVGSLEDIVKKTNDDLGSAHDIIANLNKEIISREKSLRFTEFAETDKQIRVIGTDFTKYGEYGPTHVQLCELLSEVAKAKIHNTELVDFRILGRAATKHLPSGKVLPKSAPIIATLCSKLISDTILNQSRNQGFQEGPRFSKVFPQRLQNEVDRLRELGSKIYKEKQRKTRVIPINHPVFGKLLTLQTRGKEDGSWIIEDREKVTINS
jgi:hypothetical protein